MKDKDFAARLAQACDADQKIPPAHFGRQAFIAKKLEVSEESASKWFKGTARPRAIKMQQLAELLGVDTGWLAFGQKPAMSRKEMALASRKTEGVVHLALGMSMLSGASCARPSEADSRKSFVDYYMILENEQIAVHAALAREVSPGHYEVLVPAQFRDVNTVAFISLGAARTHMLNMDPDLIEKHKQPKAGAYAITLTAKPGGVYTTGRDEWPRMSNIGELI